MTDDKHNRRPFTPHGEPPNPLNFHVKGPLRETYLGHWKQLPVVQKIGILLLLVFGPLETVSIVWRRDGGHHLIALLPLVVVMAILAAFVLVLSRSVR